MGKQVTDKYAEAFERIGRLCKSKEKVVVGIDGNSCAGKSSLAKKIAEKYDCNVFHMDDFFLRPSQRTLERLEEPGGNVDYERFKSEVADKIMQGKPFCYRPFDCSKQEFRPDIEVVPKKIAIVEGSYSMHPYLEIKYDLRIFLETGRETQRARVLERNGPRMYKRFTEEWIPMENKYFNAFDIRARSDLIYKTQLR